MKQEIRSLFSDAVQLKNEGAFGATEKILTRSKNQDSRSPALLASLAYTYGEMGRLDDAISTFRTAAMLAPKSEAISLGLFHSLWETGDRQGALAEAKRFTEHSNSDAYAEIMKEIKRRRTQH